MVDPGILNGKELIGMGKDLYGKELGPGFGQRKNGQYYARFENRFGVRKTIYGIDLQEVRDKYNTAVYEDKKRMNILDDSVTLDEYFETWIEIHKYGVIGPDTKQGYLLVYKKHISPVLGKRRLTEITLVMVKSLLNNLDKRGYGFETRNRVRIMLKDIFGKAVQDDLLLKNPAKGVKLVRDEEKEIRVLSKEEQMEFFECTAGTFYYNLFVAAIETGLRPGELYALEVADVDFENMQLHVSKTLVYQKYEDDDKKQYHLG